MLTSQYSIITMERPTLFNRIITNIRIFTAKKYYSDDHLTVTILGNVIKLPILTTHTIGTYDGYGLTYSNCAPEVTCLDGSEYLLCCVYENSCHIKIREERVFILFSDLTYAEDEETLIKKSEHANYLASVELYSPTFVVLNMHACAFIEPDTYRYKSTGENLEVLIVLDVVPDGE